jgi:glucose/arabinose dehydrogenase
MRRQVTYLILSALLAGCTTTTQPTPTGPPGTGCDGKPMPEPANLGTPSCTQTPAPTPTLTPGATPTATSGPTAKPTATAQRGLVFKLLAEHFGDLTFVTNAGDGSGLLYAVEQAGTIRILTTDGTVQTTPFLDIAERIASGGERGLLGLAFHQNYAENGRFFVDYTDTNGDTVVSEFRRSAPTSADPGSERILFTVEQPFANHNGGMVAFGPDGALYIGLGDGGSEGDPQGNGQNGGTFLSKIVRLDVDAAPGPNSQPTIWDSGLRNPWRFSFDRQTGDLFIGDVGQGAWEEIDAEPAGAGGRNYGWNIMEGTHCYNADTCVQTGLTLPVAEYSHSAGCSVTGGYVYRGSAMPGLVGMYLYSDFCSGTVWGIDAAAAIAGAEVRPVKLGSVGLPVSAFGQDEAGELYIVDHSGRVVTINQ